MQALVKIHGSTHVGCAIGDEEVQAIEELVRQERQAVLKELLAQHESEFGHSWACTPEDGSCVCTNKDQRDFIQDFIESQNSQTEGE